MEEDVVGHLQGGVVAQKRLEPDGLRRHDLERELHLVDAGQTRRQTRQRFHHHLLRHFCPSWNTWNTRPTTRYEYVVLKIQTIGRRGFSPTSFADSSLRCGGGGGGGVGGVGVGLALGGRMSRLL